MSEMIDVTRPVGRRVRVAAADRPQQSGVFGCAIVGFWLLVAIAAPWIAPFPPNIRYVRWHRQVLGPGGVVFWFGTDHLGRDILSRVIWGTRTVLVYAPLATALSFSRRHDGRPGGRLSARLVG